MTVRARAREGRRRFLRSSASVAVAPFVVSLAGLHARQLQAAAAGGASQRIGSPYGPVAPVNDQATGLPLLSLPRGFSYTSHGWTGDPMSAGGATPGNHDGMAVIRSRRVGRSTEFTLVRNHELGVVAAGGIAARARYDSALYQAPPDLPASALPPGTRPVAGGRGIAGGGTTNLIYRDGRFVESFPSLGGTLVNCAGGATPWGTWLSCEETLADYSALGGRRHGYVFEVHPEADRTDGAPVIGMGRFMHEAVAVDPASGHVYQTEDNRNVAGFYRYVPRMLPGGAGSLQRGGRLQAARVAGMRNADLLVPRVGDSHRLEWVDVSEPDAGPQTRADFPDFGPAGGASGTALLSGPFAQAWDAGGLRMSRGEGLWYWNRRIYLVDSTAGLENRAVAPGASPRRGHGDGAVWELDLDRQMLRCVYAVPGFSPEVGNNPDNVTVSPRGGVLLCEDGGTFTLDGKVHGSRLMGLTAGGGAYAFCENHQTETVMAAAYALGKDVPGGAKARSRIRSEFAGACFDPGGQVLFVNLYSPGLTVAITGPWGKGPL